MNPKKRAEPQRTLENGKIVEYQKIYKNRELFQFAGVIVGFIIEREREREQEEKRRTRFGFKKVECKNYNFQRSTRREVCRIKSENSCKTLWSANMQTDRKGILDAIMKALTNGLLKFLTRISGTTRQLLRSFFLLTGFGRM